MSKLLFFIGLLMAQIIAGGLVFILVFSSVLLIPLLVTKLPVLFPFIILTPILIGLAILVSSAIWTYRDVKKFISQGIDAWMPAGWVLVMLFFWFPGLTIYFFLRKFKYQLELQGRN